MNTTRYFNSPQDVIGGFTRCKKCKRIPAEIGGNRLCGNCEKIIEVRKPRVIKCFGIADIYERYSQRQEKYFASLPKNGEKIRITWLTKNKGEENAYIGFEGTVEDFDNVDGSFNLNSGKSILIMQSTSFDYIKLK